MLRTSAMLILILFSISLLAGCAMVVAPVSGGLVTSVKAPVTATSNPTASKVGTASCTSILGWIAVGDCSIEAGAKNGGITKIHHVDYKATSVLGIFASFTVHVYGE